MSKRFFHWSTSLILILALILITLSFQPARAAGPWYVSTTGDDNNDCLSPASPCATINAAIGKPDFVPGDAVQVAIGTYAGSGDEVVLITKDAILSGGWDTAFTAQIGTSTIDGQGERQGIEVSISTVVVDRFTVQNGFDLSQGQGGGIKNSFGSLTLSNSIVSDNTATSMGGGIFNFGTMTINNTVIHNNTAGDVCCFGGGGGGGIFNYSGTVTVNNSTISGNTILGGFSGSGINNSATLTLNNSTVSGNTVSEAIHVSAGGGTLLNLNNSTVSGNPAGGIYKGHGSIALNNSTISGNAFGIFMDPGHVGNVTSQNSILAGNATDCNGTMNSSGYNIIGSATDCTFIPSAGDLTNVDPLLGPLQDNGGPTFTHALLPGSPAIDAGNPSGCTDHEGNPLTTDQRGVTRPQGTRCDIGAFEVEASGGGIEVSIDIKPGSDSNPINRTSTGKTPVAILSTPEFNALSMVDRTSLTFGRTGEESSLLSCNKGGKDVNYDGLLDLVCHFKTQMTGFEIGDTQGFLKGQTLDETPLQGSDVVRIVK